MGNTLVERLRSRMKVMGLKPGEVADMAGVGHSFVHDILLRRSLNPTTEKLGRVAEILRTTVEYLINGNVEVSDSEVLLRGQAFSSIPFVNVTVSMGGDAIVGDDANARPWLFPESWLHEGFSSPPGKLRLIQITGDSMEPTLCNGDLVMIDVASTSLSHDGIFVLDDGIGLVAKRLDRVMGEKRPMVRIISDNTQYPAYERRLDEVRIIGKVVWFGRQID